MDFYFVDFGGCLRIHGPIAYARYIQYGTATGVVPVEFIQLLERKELSNETLVGHFTGPSDAYQLHQQ